MSTSTGKFGAWWVPLLLMLSVGINVGLVLGWPKTGRSQSPELQRPESQASESRASESRASEEVQAPEPLQEDQSKSTRRERLPRRLHRALVRMAEQLSLQGEDQVAFLEIQEQFFQNSKISRERLLKARAQLRRELLAAEPDPGRAEHWVQEMATAQGDLEKAFVDNYFATRALVKPAHEKKFRRLMVRIREARQELMEGQGPRRRAPVHRPRP